MTKRRLAIVVSHPIQHFVGLYAALAKTDDIDLRVFYASRIGLERYYDDEMKVEISWKMDLLGGYDHVFLPGADAITTVSFRAMDAPDLAQHLDAFDPHAVMIYGYAQMLAHRAMEWGWTRWRPVLMISDSELLRPRGWIAKLKAVLIPFIYRRVDAFLSVGDHNESYYRHYGVPEDRIFRSPFTIDEASFKVAHAARDAHRRQLREQLGLAPDALIALFVGKLSDRKRPGDLLAAVQALRERKGGAKVHAVFAGNGALMDGLEAQARATGAPAHFLGFVNVDRLPSLYAAADMLVHPSSADPHPLVCSEAACVGLPVILSDRIGAEGPTDIARAGENALVFPVGDVAALTEAMATLANDPARRAAMGARALEIFDELDVQRSIDGIRRAMAKGKK